MPRRSGSWCLDPTAKAAERRIVADLMAAAGWKGTANNETGVLGDLGQQSGCGDNPADSGHFESLRVALSLVRNCYIPWSCSQAKKSINILKSC